MPKKLNTENNKNSQDSSFKSKASKTKDLPGYGDKKLEGPNQPAE